MTIRTHCAGVLLCLWAVDLIAADRQRTSSPPVSASAQVEKNEKSPEAGQREDVEARMRDYLIRHGDNGLIDANLLLRRTRELQQELRRPLVRPDALNGSVWVELGPTNGAGRMLSVAPHPTVPNTAIVGSAGGGAWKTTDAGVTWTAITESLPNIAIGAVAYAPSNPNVVYLGTGEAGPNGDRIPGIGIVSSSDGGTNWTLPSSVLATGFHRLSVHPTNPQELVAGTNNGAWRSTNGIEGPWTQVIPGGVLPGFGQVADVIRDPSNASVLYAATWDGANCTRTSCRGAAPTVGGPTVMKSVDGGVTWAPAASGLPVSTAAARVSRISLAIAPSSPQTIYASFVVFATDTFTEGGHVFKTTDGGATWTQTAFGNTASVNTIFTPQAGYDNTIVVSPNDPNIVMAAGVRYARSVDGGQTWVPATFSGTSVHVDAHDLRYDAGGLLYIANDGGIWTSADHGARATARNTGLVTRQFYFVTNDPVNPNRIFGGLQDNGTIRRPDAGGTEWQAMIGGDGLDCVVNPLVPSIVFGSVQNAILLRTLTAGATNPRFRDVSPLFESSDIIPFRTLYALDPANPAVMYTVSNRVWKSADAGESWVPLPTTTLDGTAWPTDRSIASISISRSRPEILMVSFSGSSIVHRSTDGGRTWRRTSNGFPNRSITTVRIDPRNPDRVFATFAGMTGPSVYVTTDGGGSWTSSANGLPLFSAQSLLYDPISANVLYCGTHVGVYRSTDGGATWTRFGTGMPAVGVDDLEVLDDGSTLRAATHGRGMWELQIEGVTNRRPTVSITAPSTPQRVVRGTTVAFSGTFSDPDAGDSAAGKWIFPDDWSVADAVSGGSVSHAFPRAGRFPVTLRATDRSGAVGAATFEVQVIERGDSCDAPIVIPGSGSFPWTMTVNTEVATTQTSDPPTGSPCYNFTRQPTTWFEFTPTETATYEFSLCGSRSSGVLVGFTGAACGPYAQSGVCFTNPAVAGQSTTSPATDCETGRKAFVSLTAGATIRLALWNFYSNDFGPTTLTVSRGTAMSPVVMSVSPGSGPAAGGLPVTIIGSGFTPEMTVKIGGNRVTDLVVVTPNLARAKTPAGTPGNASVVAEMPDGRVALLNDGFSYRTAPVVTTPDLRRRGVRY